MGKKLVYGILAGAAIGAAVSLMNRETREKAVQKVTNLKTDAQYYYYNRDELKQKATEKFSKVQGIVEMVMENKEYYLEKIAEFRETPKLTEEVKIAKEVTNQGVDDVKKAEDVIHL